MQQTLGCGICGLTIARHGVSVHTESALKPRALTIGGVLRPELGHEHSLFATRARRISTGTTITAMITTFQPSSATRMPVTAGVPKTYTGCRIFE